MSGTRSYKTDPDLQALHAKAPAVAIWDDHEIANDTWSGGAENDTEAAAGTGPGRTPEPPPKRADFEWMPVRPALAARTTYRLGRASAGSSTCPCWTCAPSGRRR
ncbi:hypothetical protein STANM309S_06273 [Streptomyces tanashiensis]